MLDFNKILNASLDDKNRIKYKNKLSMIDLDISQARNDAVRAQEYLIDAYETLRHVDEIDLPEEPPEELFDLASIIKSKREVLVHIVEEMDRRKLNANNS